MKKNPYTETIQVRITPEQKRRLLERGKVLSTTIREAIDTYIKEVPSANKPS